MTPLLRKFLGLHWILFASMILMAAMGIYSIYGAVHFRPEPGIANQWNTQIRWALIGIVVFFGAALVDYKWIRWACLPLYVAGLGLLVLQGLKGKDTHGQVISINIGGVSVQAAQLAVMATILLLGVLLGEAHKYIPWLRHYLVRFMAAGLVFAVPFALVVKQGDLGTALVMIPIVAVMLLVGNIPFRCLVAVALIGLTILPPVFYFKLKDYQRARIQVPIDMLMGREVDVKGDGYAATNLQIGIGSAGWEGKGTDPNNLPPGQKSMLQLGLTSKSTAHTDYIFGSAAESFGFRGAAIMIIGFLFMLTMCIMVSFFARDQAGRLVVAGIVGLFFAHIFEHVGMNIGIMPITGIPLPLISYGGTFMVVNFFLLGLVQSVWVHRNAMIEEAKAKAKPKAKVVAARALR
ncbi:MAG: rod shape-determining protein RodA [Verrucomicrobiaceae bacterium]|nr:MAG: rod shape-determining protein RodA [Verrucomicrobiaceae bacterium]